MVEPKDADGAKDVQFWIEGDSKKVKECHVIVTTVTMDNLVVWSPSMEISRSKILKDWRSLVETRVTNKRFGHNY